MSAVATPVVQFGTSRFLQAHADLFIHEAATGGEAAGPVCIVAGSGGVAGKARLAAFNRAQGYSVMIRGIADGIRVESEIQVKSVVRGLDASAEWAEITRVVVQEAAFVISNTTEAGLTVAPDAVVDLSDPRDLPAGYPARLLKLLAARQAENPSPLVILPTELVQRNGDTLRRAVLELAQRSRAPDALIGWIAKDCVFANALVDRIVSAPIEPAGAVTEPYALWAVERQPGLVMPCTHPAIRIVDDLEPVERLKIHILNLGHSILADRWLTTDLPRDALVRGLLADGPLRDMLLQIYADEVIPGFGARGMRDEAVAYVTATLERFDNPFLDHRLADIATGHTEKVRRRIAGFIDWVSAAGGPTMPHLERVAARSAQSALAGA